MQIDEKMLAYLEDLSFLTLSGEEKSRLKADLEKILNGIERLGELDTEGVPECTHVFDNVNIFREDKVDPFVDRELILKNAPARNDEMFIAPKTIE